MTSFKEYGKQFAKGLNCCCMVWESQRASTPKNKFCHHLIACMSLQTVTYFWKTIKNSDNTIKQLIHKGNEEMLTELIVYKHNKNGHFDSSEITEPHLCGILRRNLGRLDILEHVRTGGRGGTTKDDQHIWQTDDTHKQTLLGRKAWLAGFLS